MRKNTLLVVPATLALIYLIIANTIVPIAVAEQIEVHIYGYVFVDGKPTREGFMQVDDGDVIGGWGFLFDPWSDGRYDIVLTLENGSKHKIRAQCSGGSAEAEFIVNVSEIAIEDLSISSLPNSYSYSPGGTPNYHREANATEVPDQDNLSMPAATVWATVPGIANTSIAPQVFNHKGINPEVYIGIILAIVAIVAIAIIFYLRRNS